MLPYDRYKQLLEESTEKSEKFPWHWYGGIPKTGELHSYVLKIIHKYAPGPLKPFLQSRHAFFELKAIVNNSGSENGWIEVQKLVSYCEDIYEKPADERKSTEREVFDYIMCNSLIIDDLKMKIKKHVGLIK